MGLGVDGFAKNFEKLGFMMFLRDLRSRDSQKARNYYVEAEIDVFK